MAKARWISLRMAAQTMALPFLPLALRRWQKARMGGLCRHATKAGIYKALRKAASPFLAIWVLPVHSPDWRRLGASPAKATAYLGVLTHTHQAKRSSFRSCLAKD
jgi:hypothetical protein